MAKSMQSNIGRVPPQDIETEEAVLGALLLEPDAILTVTDVLQPTDFYKQENGIVYETIVEMFAKGQKIDMLTVISEIKKRKDSNEITAFYVSGLTKNVAAAAHIEAHTRIIVDLSLKRQIAFESQRIGNLCFDESLSLDSILDSVANFSDRILSRFNTAKQIKTFNENLNETVEHIKHVQENFNRSEADGIVPFVKSVRKFIPEFEPGNLIVNAGRPGMGKTTYALINEALEQALAGNPVAVFSLEMTARELVKRMISRETGFDKYELSMPFSAEKWSEFDGSLSRLNGIDYFIDDTPLASFAHIKSRAKVLKKRFGLKLIVIDYLQLMAGDPKLNREQQLSTITRELKALAKELDLPIIVLSQLNRNVEIRGGEKKPMLADLRESGAIEQDSDIVMLMYRPYYYFKNEDIRNIATAIISKNRTGGTGEADMFVSTDVTKFADIAAPEQTSFTDEAPYSD